MRLSKLTTITTKVPAGRENCEGNKRTGVWLFIERHCLVASLGVGFRERWRLCQNLQSALHDTKEPQGVVFHLDFGWVLGIQAAKPS